MATDPANPGFINPAVAKTSGANPIILYDGVCGLCDRLVRFTLQRDTNGRFRFASLQSNFTARILQRHALDPHDLNTVYLVEDCDRPGERLLARSDAVVSILRQLGGAWRVTAALLRVVPRWLRDWGYKMVARNRYRIFGRSDTCLLPEAKYRDRFLDA
jgi:predicted DCC family thiol-disulfide oxidoreductase YuxK